MMRSEKLNTTLNGSKHEILQFIIPEGNKHMVFEEGNFLRQYVYQPYSSPDLVVMREECGLMPRDCTFTIRVMELSGPDLNVISCTGHTRTEITAFNAGYPFIRLPPATDRTEKWEYCFSEGITVKCQSVRINGRIKGVYQEILQVKRDMVYCDHQVADNLSTVEYYLNGVGMYKMAYVN